MTLGNYSVRVFSASNNPAREENAYVHLKHGDRYSLVLRNFSDKDSVGTIFIDGKEIVSVKVSAKDKVQVDSDGVSDEAFTFFKAGSVEASHSDLNSVSGDSLGLIQVKFVEIPSEMKFEQKLFGTQIIYVPVYPAYRPFFEWYTEWVYRPSPYYPYWNGTSAPGLVLSPSITISNTTGTFSESVSGSSVSINSTYLNNTQFTYTSSSGGTGMSGIAEYVPMDIEENKAIFEKNIDKEITTISLRLICSDDTEVKPKPLKGKANPVPPPLV